MKPPMRHTAYKLTITRNAYGDYVSSGETALICHFRYITTQAGGANSRGIRGNESADSDAMAWFEPDSGVEREDLIKFEGEHFRVEKVTKARRLRDPTVQFIKVELLKYGVIS
jgi:hypothetical protein